MAIQSNHKYFLALLYLNDKNRLRRQLAFFSELNKTTCNSISILINPNKLRTKFATFVEKVEGLKIHYQQSLKELQNMYGVLSQKAFRGELKGEAVSTLRNTKKSEFKNEDLGMVTEGKVKYKNK